MAERITKDAEFDGYERNAHEYRYKLAGKYTKDTDTVLDMACGTGYGAEFLKGTYKGVDIADLSGNIVADLTTWKPDFDFDVGVSFETIEHIQDYQNILDNLKKAKKYIVYSTPIIPTVGINPWHLHDFTMNELKDMFKDWGKIIYEEIQDKVYGILVIEKYEV